MVWVNNQWVPDAPTDKPPARETPEPYFYTGYGGNKPSGYQSQGTGGVYFGQTPGTPGYNATAGAFQLQNEDYDSALATLGGREFLPQGAGNAAMQKFTNPRGFDPMALKLRMAALADTEAGSRMNNLDTLEKTAAARGFRTSVGALDAAARVRANSAANLMRSQNEVFYEGEKAKLQEMGIGANVLGGLTAAEVARLRAYASLQASRPRDVIPGISPGPNGEGGMGNNGGFQYLNERGEIIPRPNWTQWDYDQAMRERNIWVATH